MSALVGIDVGGTAIKGGAVSADGEVLDKGEIPAAVDEGPEAVVDRIAALARGLGARAALGLGVPGLLDRDEGVVLSSPNLRPLDGFPLRDELARRLGIAPPAVRIENDANVAAIGEHWLGGARGEDHVLMITLGTGVGGGLILDGHLFVGDGGGGEVGHTVVDPAGPPCGCGQRGCVEVLASATAARRRALEAGLSDDLIELAAAARAAQGPERTLLEAVGRDLGRGLGTVVTLLDVRCFLIGGGFGRALDVLIGGIAEGIAERSTGPDREDLRILPATLGPDAGWIGAARMTC
ncbi:MAG: ROK family protein [Planctomycetota bacterium]|nr:ROK family protein [Planctomycetota bacterium]MDP6761808.1 ROK family protein [Planctomycetota bacterium]MDP6988854.1 ROK family protein [Planctomycetota bacterium]